MSPTHLDHDLLAGLIRRLAAESDLTSVWQRVVDASMSQIDGAQHAGITVLGRRSVSTPVASDPLVQEVDKRQYATGQGPCLAAAVDHQPIVRVDDLRTDPRWPEFAAEATGLGVLSMLSFQLYTDNENIGALNVYAESVDAFSDDSVQTGALLAAHAAVAAARATNTDNLRIALASRDVIGQAKGILMERFKITAPQAFDLLIAASQHSNRKLREIAEDLAETGQLRGDERPSA